MWRGDDQIISAISLSYLICTHLMNYKFTAILLKSRYSIDIKCMVKFENFERI